MFDAVSYIQGDTVEDPPDEEDAGQVWRVEPLQSIIIPEIVLI